MGSPGKGGKGKGKGVSAPPKEMAAEGTSKPWMQAKDNHVKVGDKFLEYIAEHDATSELAARWGKVWMEVPEHEACGNEIFGHLATYLADVHLIEAGNRNQGQLYDPSSAETVWSGLVQCNKKLFSKSTEERTKVGTHMCLTACTMLLCAGTLHICTCMHSAPCFTLHRYAPTCAQHFFMCLEKNSSEQREWYLGIKRNMERQINARKAGSDEKLDNSATELYHDHVKAIVRSVCTCQPQRGSRSKASRDNPLVFYWACFGAGLPGILWLEMERTA